MGKQQRNRKVSKRPTWSRFLPVYVVIEGFDFGADGERVRAELNQKAPYAYTRATRLGSIWRRLSEETQAALEVAWQREKEGAVIPRARKAAS